MRTNIVVLLGCLAAAIGLLGCSTAARSSDPKTPQPQDPKAGAAKGVVTLDHLTVDLKDRRIVIDAEVCQPSYALEFLLCYGNEKTYESILTTKARPSLIHGALLMLGLTMGRPATWSDAEGGKFLPPRGAELAIQLQWREKDGKLRQIAAGKWLAPAQEGAKFRMPDKWVFVGSDLLPDGGYYADMVGGIISVANLAEAVIDVPFESAGAIEQRSFRPDRDAIPAPGTRVEMIITPLPGAEKAGDARAVLEMDNTGRMCIDGQTVAPDKLTPWARDYIRNHARGTVVIRAAAKTPSACLQTARENLRAGGAQDIKEQILPPDEPPAPPAPEEPK